MAKVLSRWELERKHKAELEKAFDMRLKAVEDELDRLADAVLPGAKFAVASRDRTAEFLTNARHLVRRIRNRNDRRSIR